jgi:hypothetical protein
MMIKSLVLLLTASAMASGAAASGKPGAGKRQMVVHEQYHADAIRLVCELIGNKTAEAARNQRRCREGASIGPGRPRGVRPRSFRR